MSGLVERLNVLCPSVRKAGSLALDLREVDAFLRREGKKGVLRPRMKDEDGRRSLVTRADPFMELLIRTSYMKSFQDDTFRGEEIKKVIGSSGWEIGVDGIDSTYSYINGERTFAISVYLQHLDAIVGGIVYNPCGRDGGDLYVGGEGITATLNGVPLPKWVKRNPEFMVLNLQLDPRQNEIRTKVYGMAERMVIAKVAEQRGSLAYNLTMVAEGAHNAFLGITERGWRDLDVAAGTAIINAAGGRVYMDDSVLLAATTVDMYRYAHSKVAEIGIIPPLS